MKDPYGLIASGLPPEMAAQAMGLTKREALMQALLEQSQQGIEAPQVKGRFQGAISPLQGVAKLAQAYFGATGSEKAQKSRADIASAVEKQRADALLKYEQMRTGTPGNMVPPSVSQDELGNEMPMIEQGGVKGDPRRAVMEAMNNPLLAGNPMVAADLKGMQPVTVGRTLMEPATGRVVASDPVVAEERAAREQMAKDAREQRMAELQMRIEDQRLSRQERAQAQQDLARLVSSLRAPPQPQPLESVVGPDGKPTLVQRADAIGKTPASRSATERNIPAPVLQAMATNEGNMRRAQMALDLVSGKDVKMPGPNGQEIVMKGDPAATGWKGYLPDALLQRADKQGIDARAVIGDLGSMVIHDRSGAAVTAAEFPRLRPFIPLPTDDNATVKKKLARFVAEYAAVNNEMRGMFSEDQGYRQPQNRRAADAAPVLKFDAQGNQIQ